MNLSLPGNPRYQPTSLQDIFGYDKLYVAVGEVEIATIQTLGNLGIIPPEDLAHLTDEKIAKLLSITTTEVDKVEREVTKHDIRAWIRIAQGILGPPLNRWVHVPLTSYDALDTARALQFARAHQNVVHPLVRKVISILMERVTNTADKVQIGRTHGQHALPITVGFWLATILSRVIYSARQTDAFARGLVGKISGAVGAHNAQVGLGFIGSTSSSFENRVLSKLGLKPAPISTQIMPPEPLADYLFACVKLQATFGQFGRDCRHLMRSEIAELGEPFEKGQVGSSTMAHKRNPINFENLEGTWLKTKSEFGKVLDTMVSDHQRDLVGSSIMRDFPTIVVNLVQQLETLLRKKKGEEGTEFLRRIRVDDDALERNFEKSKDFILAEPLYIALQMAGFAGDAHELVNHRAMPIAVESGVSLLQAVLQIGAEDDAVQSALDSIPSVLSDLLEDPKRYVGDARERALAVAAEAHAHLTRYK